MKSEIQIKEERSKLMAKIKGTNTLPERIVRSFLKQEGFYYRKNFKGLPGKPDIVIRKCRTVILINGCFWHGHEGCRKFSMPKTRTEFWEAKIHRNQERDAKVIAELQKLGWDVVVLWECQLTPQKRRATLNGLLDVLYRGLLDNARCLD